MTVSTFETRKTYNGNGTTDEFATPYFLVDADLAVRVDGTLQTITTHYSVAGAGVAGGGTVTFVTPPPTGTGNVVIIRDPALTQLLDLVENDSNPAETREQAFDKLTMIAQRLAERSGRSIQLSDTDTAASMVLPVLADRASQFLGFNASGEPIAAGGTIDALLVSAFMQTLLDDADATTALATLGLSASSGEFTPVLSFGGATTGITYTTQTGTYTEVNGLINVAIAITLSSKGTATGIAEVSLPFDIASSDFSDFLDVRGLAADITGPFVFRGGTELMRLAKGNGTATNGANMSNADFTDTSRMRINTWYKKA